MRIVERAEHARGQAREMWSLRASLLLQLCPHDMWESHALLSSSERQSSHLNHGHGSPSFRAGCPLQPVDITSPGTALFPLSLWTTRPASAAPAGGVAVAHP